MSPLFAISKPTPINASLSDNVLIAIVQSSLTNAKKAAAVGTQNVCDDVLLAVLGTGLPAGQAQNFFINQSPLSDAMLIALVNSGLPPGTIQNILLANLGLSTDVIAAVNASTLPNGVKNSITNQNAGTTHTPVDNTCDGSIQNNAGTLSVLSYVQAERHLYGSSRIGLEVTETEMIGAAAPGSTEFERVLGYKQFELSEHRGNVISVVLDYKIPRDDNTDALVDYFQPAIITATDYRGFGVRLNRPGL